VRPFLLCVLVLASSAGAQAPPAPARLWLTGGAAYRDHQQFSPAGASVLHVGGTSRAIAPWNVHLSGAYFFNSFLGLNLEARGEFFYATQTGTPPVPQPSFELTPAAAARWDPVRWLSLEGQLGWSVQLRAGITGGPQLRATPFTGPSFGLAIGLLPVRAFSAQLFFRAQPFNFSLSGVQGFRAQVLAGGAQLSLGALTLGKLQLGGALTFELSSTQLGATEGSASQLGLRGGVGLSLTRAPEQVDAVLEPMVVLQKVTLSGRAVSQDGGALGGVVVSLDGENPVRTDDTGAFSFSEVTVGPHVLRARKDAFQPALQDVMLTAPPSPVTLTLLPTTGPGRIRGMVRSGEGAIAGASLTAGTQSASSDAEGHYVLENVEPGAVKVHVKASGFTDAEELAQVPPDGEATLDFTLVKNSAEVRATLRGLIRAKSGEPVSGTVRVVELKLKLVVKADGRFSAEVPSGRYTVVIEARGFLTQTKTVEVSPGDQAIFHAELERTR
jgi:hypothetical protein